MTEDLDELKAVETLSSGVTVEILPFPAQLFLKIQRKAEELHPLPRPPQKTIQVVDGTETVDDLDDPAYRAALAKAEAQRRAYSSEKVLNYLLKHCVRLDLAEWEPVICGLEADLWEFPSDPAARQLEFMTSYAARNADDFNRLVLRSLEQVTVSEPEVAKRLASFQRQVARSATGDAETPGPAAK